jgi:hypothetical protein
MLCVHGEWYVNMRNGVDAMCAWYVHGAWGIGYSIRAIRNDIW